MRKIIGSLILCIVMVVTLVPASILADEKPTIIVNVKGNSAIFNYDGQEHVVSGCTVSSDDPRFDKNKFHTKGDVAVAQTEPGTYEAELQTGFFIYDDESVKIQYNLQDPVKLTINEPTGGPTITKEPVDRTVEWPKGASFLVTVEDPIEVEEFQWMEYDGVKWFTLTGKSAKEQNLVVPATDKYDDGMKFRCRITDENGKVSYTRIATLSISNVDERKPVVYISEFAIEPGNYIDLKNTRLGTGIVSFDTNGRDITLKNVNMDNTITRYDHQLAKSNGILLFREDNTEKEYNIILEGDNVINNVFCQDNSQNGGIDLQVMMLGGDSVLPTTTIKGDGSLEVKGGTHGIYANGTLDIQAPVKVLPNNNLPGNHRMFSDAIYADAINISGAKVDITSNGSGLVAESTKGEKEAPLTISGESKVTINNTAPHVNVGDTTKYSVLASSLDVKDSSLTINANADPHEFVPYGQFLAAFGGIFLNLGDMSAKNSSIDIKMTAEGSETPYAVNFCGIDGYGYSNMTLDKSNVSIDINSSDIQQASGIYLAEDLVVKNESSVKTNIYTLEKTYGIAPEGSLTVSDSNIENSCKTESGSECYGIMSDVFKTDNTKKGYSIKSEAENGIALATNTDKRGEDEKKYDPTYKASKFALNNAEIITPEKSAISTASIPSSGTDYIYIETIYDTEDTSKPAANVVINSKDKPNVKPVNPVNPLDPINPDVKKPAKAKVKKATKKKSSKKIKVTLKKIKGAKGYQVAVSKKKKGKALYKKYVKKTKFTLKSKKFKKKKKLFVKARAYVLNGKAKVFGKWSNPKKIKIKK